MPVVFHLFSFPSKLILFDQLSFETFFSEVNTLQHGLVCWQPLLSRFSINTAVQRALGLDYAATLTWDSVPTIFFLFVFLLSAHFYNAG